MFTLVVRENGEYHCAGSVMRMPASDPKGPLRPRVSGSAASSLASKIQMDPTVIPSIIASDAAATAAWYE